MRQTYRSGNPAAPGGSPPYAPALIPLGRPRPNPALTEMPSLAAPPLAVLARPGPRSGPHSPTGATVPRRADALPSGGSRHAFVPYSVCARLASHADGSRAHRRCVRSPPPHRGKQVPRKRGGIGHRAGGNRRSRQLAHLAPGVSRRAPPRRPRRAQPGGDRRGHRRADRPVRGDGGGHRALGNRPGGHPLVDGGGGGLRRIRHRGDAPEPLHGHLPHRHPRRRDRGLGRPGRTRPAESGRHERRDHPGGRGRPGAVLLPLRARGGRGRGGDGARLPDPGRRGRPLRRARHGGGRVADRGGGRLSKRRGGRTRAGPGRRRDGGRARQGRRRRRRVGPGDHADRPR